MSVVNNLRLRLAPALAKLSRAVEELDSEPCQIDSQLSAQQLQRKHRELDKQRSEKAAALRS